MKSFIVVGLGFGDEGKGTITDYLTRKYKAVLNVRFNGSAQAAHTVVTPDNKTHIFSSFGSGSFNPGVKTLLTKDMLVNPLAMMKEYQILSKKCGVKEQDVFIDERALIVTPYHRALNRLREISRGNMRHGSCGMGVGETVNDHLIRKDECIFARDLDATWLGTGRLEKKLEQTRAFCLKQLNEIATHWNFTDEKIVKEISTFNVEIEKLAAAYRNFAQNYRIVNDEWIYALFNQTEVAIWEGAQGALLDQDCSLFQPHVTWSRTTDHNAVNYLKQMGQEDDYTTFGVLRTFMTRHGAGPFPSENVSYSLVADDHNGTGEYQGAFRVGYLELPLIKYGIDMNHRIDYLAVTHWDKLLLKEQWEMITGYGSLTCSTKSDGSEVREEIQRALLRQIKITSYGPRTDQKTDTLTT